MKSYLLKDKSNIKNLHKKWTLSKVTVWVSKLIKANKKCIKEVGVKTNKVKEEVWVKTNKVREVETN